MKILFVLFVLSIEVSFVFFLRSLKIDSRSNSPEAEFKFKQELMSSTRTYGL